jgi:hypothetical protein
MDKSQWVGDRVVTRIFSPREARISIAALPNMEVVSEVTEDHM